jgi:hypothetical protein
MRSEGVILTRSDEMELTSNIDIFRVFTSNDRNRSVVIEDNGRVAYAYLLDHDKQICSDVWLYNRRPTPIEPEWHDREGAPYANPAPFVDDREIFALPRSGDDFSVEWKREDSSYLARVHIRTTLAAVLADGHKPGWSVLAKKDGPLAKVLKQD